MSWIYVFTPKCFKTDSDDVLAYKNKKGLSTANVITFLNLGILIGLCIREVVFMIDLQYFYSASLHETLLLLQ